MRLVRARHLRKYVNSVSEFPIFTPNEAEKPSQNVMKMKKKWRNGNSRTVDEDFRFGKVKKEYIL